LIEDDGATALLGPHPSGVREVLPPRTGGRVPYVYTPIFEVGDAAPGVFFLGETAPQQLGPVVPWLTETQRARRWFLIGNDYRWPRDAHRTARAMVDRAGGTVAGEILLPLGTEDFEEAIDAIAAARPDVVIAALVGSDAVIFHRAFARAGLSESIWRLGLLTEENTLLGVGADCSDRLLTVAGYFAALDTPGNKAFVDRYLARFGPHAPALNSIGQSAYEGLIFLDEIARRAGSLATEDLERVSDGLVFHGPRGPSRMVHRHVVKDMHLAEARGIEFSILKSFPQISATGELPS
ncbi:MAG: substrate-binding domain-containing protein, partial [Bauldia litoralis]